LRKGVEKTCSKTGHFFEFPLKTRAFLQISRWFMPTFAPLFRRTCANDAKTCAFALDFPEKLAQMMRKLARLRWTFQKNLRK
jgi:hypothetical protein